MKRAIYVDYENVHISGLQAIEKLTSDDVVKIFIGSQTSKLSMQDANRIFNCEAQVELITNKFIGKNALDFIIMVHMGHDIAKELAKAYYIVSKDKGYDPAIQEMRRISEFTIERKPDINEVLNEKKSVGKRIIGFFKGKGEKEAPDTTEHQIIKKNSAGGRFPVPTFVTKSSQIKPEKADDDNKKENKADKNNQPKKRFDKKSDKTAETSKKPADAKNEPEANLAPPVAENEVKKPHRRRRRHSNKNHQNGETANAEIKLETPANAPKPESKPAEKKESKPNNKPAEKKESKQNNKPAEKKETKPNKPKKEKPVEKKEENNKPLETTGDNTEAPVKKNNRRRRNNHRNHKKMDANVSEVLDDITGVNPRENKGSTNVEKKPREKTPEELERERERDEAFALLAALNDD